MAAKFGPTFLKEGMSAAIMGFLGFVLVPLARAGNFMIMATFLSTTDVTTGQEVAEGGFETSETGTIHDCENHYMMMALLFAGCTVMGGDVLFS